MNYYMGRESVFDTKRVTQTIDRFQVWVAKTEGKKAKDVVAGGNAIPLGKLNGQEPGVGLVYGKYLYDRRAIYEPEEPRTGGITVQPALALVEGERVTPIPYGADVRGSLRTALVVHLEGLMAPRR